MRDSQKLSVFCALSTQKVFRPFFSAELDVSGTVYIGMEEFLMPILEEESPDNMVFHLYETPSYFT
jgi:hypothetical protein